MNVVMSAFGTFGDIVPFVAVGRELKHRGHGVTLVANATFERLARDESFDFVAASTADDYKQFVGDANLWEPSRTTLEQARVRHYYPHLTGHFKGVVESRNGGHTVVVSGEAGGIVAAEKLGVPLVHMACAPATSAFTRSKYDPAHPERLLPFWARWFATTGPRLSLLYRLNDLRHGRRTPGRQPVSLSEEHPVSRLRSEAGLPRVAKYVPNVRLALCMWPDWFAAPQRDWPEEALVAGFAFYPAPKATAERGTTPSDSDAPIVVTTGTAAGSQFAFYSMVVEALTPVQRAVVLVSPHRDHIPEKLPPHITWVSHAPFGDLFRTASLVVHHGGIGTAAYGLLNGVPQIVMPMRWDQFDNGNRLQRLGIARMLSPKNTSAAAFRNAVTSILSSPRVAARCRHWQSHVDVECGVRKAADAIEARCS